MIPRICTLLLLVTACQLDPKYIGDPSGDSSSAAEESGTDGASSDPINATEGYGSGGTSDSSSTSGGEPSTTSGGTSDSSSTSGGSEPSTTSGPTSDSSSTGGTVGTSESGSTSQGSATEGPSTTTTAGETEGESVNCEESFEVFPEFDKLCEVDGDCAIGLRTIDCCGTTIAIGIQTDDLEAFQQAEFMCLSTGPMCDCIPEATVAEDGKKQAEGDVIQVKCSDNLCVTSIQ